MTIEQQKQFALGYGYWLKYVSINGFALHPSIDGLRKLSQAIGVKLNTLKMCINTYLEN